MTNIKASRNRLLAGKQVQFLVHEPREWGKRSEEEQNFDRVPNSGDVEHGGGGNTSFGCPNAWAARDEEGMR